MNTKKLACAIAAILLLCGLLPAMAASISVVTNASTEVYPSQSLSGASVSIPKGVSMTLKDYSDSWGKVTYKGRTGYIALRALNLKKPVKAYVSEDAPLYGEDGSGVLGTLDKGTQVYVLGMEGDYARVSNGSKTGGYVVKSALTTRPQSLLAATSDAADNSPIEHAIYVAQSLLGRPYAFFSEPPKSFNCASFVELCYNSAQADRVKSTLAGQVHDDRYKKITSISDLKRGDLVCFNFKDSSDIYGHVGIYLGYGNFVHASSADKKVTVSKLSSGSYNKSFSWGRRIFDS